MFDKKTKIICTISDIRCDVDFLKSLYANGMNVARINSAHATLDGAQKIVDNVRQVSDKIAILIDTKGPEVRLTPMECSAGIAVERGSIVEIRDNVNASCTASTLYTNYNNFVKDVPQAAHILIDDGSVDLLVVDKNDERLLCEAQNAGAIKGRKSVNVPNVPIYLPALTEKDKMFIQWAIDNEIDFIAHSFVRNREDLIEIQKLLDERGSEIKIISKIENQQGIDNLEDILSYCYGIMVARGDLGVEIATETVPIVQKKIIDTCRSRKQPVIIATQMLHSMIENPRPTRAEVTDVANAIFQSTDAIMLSGETANGQYPVEALKTMSRIAEETERFVDIRTDVNLEQVSKPIAAVLARSLVSATRKLPVKAIILDTWTGRTGRYLAEFRPKVPIYAMCYKENTMRHLNLIYAIDCYKLEIQKSKEEMVRACLDILVKDGRLRKGELVGFIGGSFNDELGATYMEFRYV